jgi:hypothetical protein
MTEGPKKPGGVGQSEQDLSNDAFFAQARKDTGIEAPLDPEKQAQDDADILSQRDTSSVIDEGASAAEGFLADTGDSTATDNS